MKNSLLKVLLLLKKIIELLINRISKDDKAEESSKVEESNKKEEINKSDYKAKDNYGRADIEAICEDLSLKPTEKLYLIQLIANSNIADNCIEITIDQLMNLFKNNNRNQVVKKMNDLERGGVIKKIHCKKSNRYFILKYIKTISSEATGAAIVKNDTSINSNTVKCKEIITEEDKVTLTKVVIENIRCFKKGIDLNEKYLGEIMLKSNKLE